MKLFSNDTKTTNELLPAIVVLQGNIEQRLEKVKNVNYRMDIAGVVLLDKTLCFHCQLKVIIEGNKPHERRCYTHDMLVNSKNVDDQINACLLSVQEQFSIAKI